MKLIFYGDSITKGDQGVSFVNLINKKIPDLDIINFGKNGDTLKSLYRRIFTSNINKNCDVAILFIGVNDIFSNLLRHPPIIKYVKNKKEVTSFSEFGKVYSDLLEFILKFSKRVITIPPLLIGEFLENPYNNDLFLLKNIIKKVSSKYNHVSFLDIQSIFYSKIKKIESSSYLPKKVMGMVKDNISIRLGMSANKISQKRKLNYTIDGVHLNFNGAEIVANEITKEL